MISTAGGNRDDDAGICDRGRLRPQTIEGTSRTSGSDNDGRRCAPADRREDAKEKEKRGTMDETRHQRTFTRRSYHHHQHIRRAEDVSYDRKNTRKKERRRGNHIQADAARTRVPYSTLEYPKAPPEPAFPPPPARLTCRPLCGGGEAESRPRTAHAHPCTNDDSGIG